MKTLALALLCALPVSVAVPAEIYRWVDGNGITHFSQDPPQGTAYKRVTPEITPATPAPHVDALRNEQRADAARAAEQAKTREAGLKLKAQTLERCAKARERINFLQEKTARRLFSTGPDGKPVRFTEEEFQIELDKARHEADQSCS